MNDICRVCTTQTVGNYDHPRGWLIVDRTQRDSPQLRVCGTCEKLIGDANMRLAGYTQDIRGAWKR